MLALLAAASVIASAIPEDSRLLLAGLVLLHGLALARRVQGQPACSLELADEGNARVQSDGTTLELTGIDIEFRAALVRLQGRDRVGRMHRLVWWPGMLAPAERRALALAARGNRSTDTTLPSMAA